MANIGAEGEGPSNPPGPGGGGGDPAHAASSEHLATDASFSIDDLTADPVAFELVDLQAASETDIQAAVQAQAEAELYVRSLPDPVIAQWKSNYLEALTRDVQRRANTVDPAQSHPSLKPDSPKMLINIQNLGGGFETLKAAKKWINELYPDTKFNSLPTSFRGFELPKRSLHTEIPFGHLAALFPELLSRMSQSSADNPEYDRPRHHCAAAGFCAVLAADYQAIIDSWARFYGLPGGLKMDDCYKLSRRALALLYPGHPVLGEKGPDSFQVPPGPYFRHVKSSTTVPIPLPPGGLSIPPEFTRIIDHRDRPDEQRKNQKRLSIPPEFTRIIDHRDRPDKQRKNQKRPRKGG